MKSSNNKSEKFRFQQNLGLHKFRIALGCAKLAFDLMNYKKVENMKCCVPKNNPKSGF